MDQLLRLVDTWFPSVKTVPYGLLWKSSKVFWNKKGVAYRMRWWVVNQTPVEGVHWQVRIITLDEYVLWTIT